MAIDTVRADSEGVVPLKVRDAFEGVKLAYF